MTKVTDISSRFVPKQELILMCPECECQVWWLDEAGTITCKACKAAQLVPDDWLEKAMEHARIKDQD